jgi:hypothetical protein
MRSTLECKQAQLANGYWETGSGPLQVFILGSCRTLAYVNYLERYNLLHNTMTIRRIDPCDWNWDLDGQPVDGQAMIDRCETDERVLAMLRKTQVFIHEYYRYFGMFNTDRAQPKHIYDFGLTPEVDVCIPNFHDRWVLGQEQVNVGLVPSKEYGLSALDKFYEICARTSFPEFAEQLKNSWTCWRYFWTGNHVSRHFTLGIFRLMNEKFLHLPLDKQFWDGAEQEDQFCYPCTPVTQWDVDAYGLRWDNMTIEELKLP